MGKRSGRSEEKREPKRPASGSSRRRRRASEPDPMVARQAAGHSRIRKDHSAEIAEDYVELIAHLMEAHGEARTVDIARRLGVSHVTVTKTIARLQKEGLVRSAPYRSIFLTETGLELARRSSERHRLVVAFLMSLGVDSDTAETDAEGIEHHVSESTMAAIRRFVAQQQSSWAQPE